MQVKILVDGVELHMKSVKVNWTISNYSEWAMAWDRYAGAVHYLYPHRANKLSVYTQYISQTFSFVQPSLTSHIINYDKAICAHVICQNDALLTDFFGNLYTLHVSSEGAAFTSTPSKMQGVRE